MLVCVLWPPATAVFRLRCNVRCCCLDVNVTARYSSSVVVLARFRNACCVVVLQCTVWCGEERCRVSGECTYEHPKVSAVPNMIRNGRWVLSYPAGSGNFGSVLLGTYCLPRTRSRVQVAVKTLKVEDIPNQKVSAVHFSRAALFFCLVSFFLSSPQFIFIIVLPNQGLVDSVVVSFSAHFGGDVVYLKMPICCLPPLLIC